jgi:hypothetical protein
LSRQPRDRRGDFPALRASDWPRKHAGIPHCRREPRPTVLFIEGRLAARPQRRIGSSSVCGGEWSSTAPG